jgi:hypothetical protein
LILCDLLNLTLPFELQASGGGGGGLVAPALSHSSSTRTAIGLAWTAATGATGAVVYDLYRDGELYAAGVSSPYSATADLGQLTVYVWTVVATDDAGSVTSNGVEAALEFDGSAGGGGGAGAGVWLRQATRDLAPIPQASGPTDVWSILDRDGAAVDLTGRTIRFVVGKVTDAGDVDDPTDDVLAGAYQYQSGDDANVSVGGGTDNNQVTVRHLPARTATAGAFLYWLWDVTTSGQEVVLARGSFIVRPAVKSTT